MVAGRGPGRILWGPPPPAVAGFLHRTTHRRPMKYLIALVLGLGSISAVACKSAPTADVQNSKTVTLAVSGMT